MYLQSPYKTVWLDTEAQIESSKQEERHTGRDTFSAAAVHRPKLLQASAGRRYLQLPGREACPSRASQMNQKTDRPEHVQAKRLGLQRRSEATAPAQAHDNVL